MIELKGSLTLTPHKYPPRYSETLTEIQYYLKAYNESKLPPLKNPFNGQEIKVVEFFEPMVRQKFIIPGIALTLIAFLMNIYVLKNLRIESAVLSYIAFVCANLGAALLLPTFVIITLNRIKHSRAKAKARKLASGEKRRELPHLEKVKNELIIELSKDYSPIMTNLSEIFDGLKKDITAEQLAIIFNCIFADENADLSTFLSDAEKFENGKNNFKKMLQNGLDYGAEMGMIEDPKFIQFLTYSFAIRFLKENNLEQGYENNFAELHLATLNNLYQDFCGKFLYYCKSEYAADSIKKNVEDRIIKLVNDFIESGEIKSKQARTETLK